MPTSPVNILVVGPSWVGDMIMAQSLFMHLKQRDPAPEIDVLAPGWGLPLLDRMPEIRAGIELPVGHGRLGLRARYRVAHSLRRKGYRQTIVLPNSWKSALVPAWAGIPLRSGYRGEQRWGLLNDMRTLDRNRLPQTVQRFVALGHPRDVKLPPVVPAPKLQVDGAQVKDALRSLGLCPPGKPLLALCPGAEYGPAKRWPAGYFARVSQAMKRRGWETWVFGSQRDGEVARDVCAQTDGDAVNLTGRTTLAQAVDLLSLADLVVTNDSGLMHVASALDRRVIALFGSSDPGFTPPLGDRAQVLSLGLSCSPCFQRRCPLGHLRCLRDLLPERVLDLVAAEFGRHDAESRVVTP